MNREDFPFLKTGKIYFDNGATSLKPSAVIESMVDYYENYSANIHRGDYEISLKASDIYDQAREVCQIFMQINQKKSFLQKERQKALIKSFLVFLKHT